jgi:uncharacterized protein (TIGR02598 family)
MKSLRTQSDHRRRQGFSLAEATLSIGLFSFGFLSLVPLLAFGLKTARQTRDSRTTVQIAQTLIEEARQGTLHSGPLSLDLQGNACPATQAVYTAQTTLAPVTAGPGGAAGLTQLTLRVVPRGSPDRARIYAVVFSSTP